MKVFLVDDDPFHLSMVQHLLQGVGKFQISTMQDGIECINKLDSNPDIVFLDHNMLYCNGFQVMKKIKQYDPKIHVVIISGEENIDEKIDFIRHGAFEFITKDDHLYEKISQTLERIENARTSYEKKGGFFNKIFGT
ncbi:MAG: response regulator [Cyclobacteriaceae bacterium]|nr:response regulator [Cyclobacteriaceae bacterium]MCH8515064.1 response regulator [Cyclobacteriaceae bacterium]